LSITRHSLANRNSEQAIRQKSLLQQISNAGDSEILKSISLDDSNFVATVPDQIA
jgi:hypothetical protein